MNGKISNPFKNLFLLDLDQPSFNGFRRFISCWIYRSPGLNFVVDPGPANTIHLLIDALKNLGITKLDFILLTHIHLDHAGGSGQLLNAFPSAKVVCHRKGIAHLINPDKLNEGTIKVLGNLAKTFKMMEAIPNENIVQGDSFVYENIRVIDTPGHASHHQSFLFRDMLFCGEALGTSIEMPDHFYLRLATPPPFRYDIFKSSIKKIKEASPTYLCFAHYGFRRDSMKLIDAADEQLEMWISFLRQKEIKSEFLSEKLYVELFAELLAIDPNMSGFRYLPEDIQSREKYFSQNSLKGMIHYLEKERSHN